MGFGERNRNGEPPGLAISVSEVVSGLNQLLGKLIFTSNVVIHGSFWRGLTLVGTFSRDALHLPGSPSEAPSPTTAYQFSFFHGPRTLDTDIHLVPIGQSTDDVAPSHGSVASDFIEVRAFVLFGLSSGDFHGLCPGTFAFGNRKGMVGTIPNVQGMLFIWLAALYGARDFDLRWSQH